MARRLNRRAFMEASLAAAACGATLGAERGRAAEAAAKAKVAPGGAAKKPAQTLPTGKIGKMTVSRMLLGGNLLTHYTHSRDLKYVYRLTANYNTEEKILETLALAEQNGINTLSIHNHPPAMKILKKYREKHGGKIQWIVCPTADIVPGMKDYRRQVDELIDMGTEAIYVWGVRSDPLAAQGKLKLLAEAVELPKLHNVPSGVGGHDLNVVKQCEKHKVPADFYIKTFHHHRYPTGPRPDELTGPYREYPGYWCKDPKETIEVMAKVTKPWIAFKVMAAGAIPPKSAFEYVFANGADHVLAGMFDFEIAEDARIVKDVLAKVKRSRPWES